MVKAAPPCGQLRTETSPPWAAAMRSTMVSPSPVPPLLVVKNGSNRRGLSSSVDARTAVGDLQFHTTRPGGAGHRQFAAARHGVERVEDQVERGAPQHVAVGQHGELRGHVQFRANALGGELRGERFAHLPHQRLHADQLPGRITMRCELE